MCFFYGNKAGDIGGAIYLEDNSVLADFTECEF
jgi:predicted outer membrane repeat protein